MQELTLTGGTMVDNNNNSIELAKPQNQYSHHDHSHSHGASSCCNSKPTVSLAMPIPELVKQPEKEVRQGITLLIRSGPFELFQQVWNAWLEVDQCPFHNDDTTLSLSLDTLYDDQGHTFLHWAAKRTDVTQFLETVLPYHQPYLSSLTTRDHSNMTPLHWACTEDKALPVLKLLLQACPQLLETSDATGCSPLLIAAQYGRVETAAYLIQKGANRQAIDEARDTAIHWAAYKGSIPVLGLLTHYDTSPLTKPDAYLQTPLHLAALRGHVGACRYILQLLSKQQQRDILTRKDKNDRTPRQLAIHKQQPHVAAFLEMAEEDLEPRKHLKHVLQKNIIKLTQVDTWKQWMGLMDPDDSPKMPYYYVWLQYALHLLFLNSVFYPWTHTEDGRLWDHTFSLFTQHVFLFLNVYFLRKIAKTDPGRIDKQPKLLAKLQKEYEDALEAFADEDAKTEEVQLCHTCHIVRPPRSKHDRYSRSCVLLFDHHCPFTSNTIGLYNYSHFYFFLLTMAIFLLGFWYLFIMYLSRADKTSLSVLALGLFLGFNIFMPGFMLFYHTLLTLHNLTTNEQIMMHRYDYFWEKIGENRRFRNPFDKGRFHNFVERLFHPGPGSYELSTQQRPLLSAIEQV